MKHLLILISAFLLVFPDARAQVKYSNEFLSIGIGARQMGMGGAGTARIDDVTAGYWNPAGLCDLKGKMDFGLMHSEYFAGLAKLDYGGFAMKTDH